MANILVSEVLQAFSSAYRSIDLRTVAVKRQATWENAITSMFMSSESLRTVKSEQMLFAEKSPRSEKFRIFLDCYPSKQALEVVKQLENEVVIGGVTIKINIHDPLNLRINEYLPSYLKEDKNWKLIGSEAESPKDNFLWNILDSQNGPARLIGYENIYELIRETLRIRDFDRGRSRGLVIGIPMPARIADMTIDKSKLKIRIKKVSPLDNLQLNISAKELPARADYHQTYKRKTQTVKKYKENSKWKLCSVTNSVRLPSLKPHDRIEVELIHRQVPTLGMDNSSLMVPLDKPSKPFAQALNAFCSLDLFRDRLLKPEGFSTKKTKPNIVFENAVAWLLSIAGFSVAQLGRRFENLKVPKTGYQIGSVDMIAYKENEYLLLVDCDTSIPDEKKVRSMKLVRDHFKTLQDERGEPSLLSIIFSPKDCTGIEVDHMTTRIVDRHRIERIFEEAMRGETKKAQDSVTH